MNLILNNQRAVAVNIDYELLKENSYQLEDYTLVMDNRPVYYKDDDGGMQDNSRIAPINPVFFTMELLHPYCTPSVYNMSCEEFKDSN